MDLKERFLKYVSYDTQSSEESTTFPSTEKQKVLLAALRDEMEALGMTEDGEYVLTCEDGTVYNEQELCAITNRRPQTVRYALSVLVRFGAYEPLATTQPE